MTQRVVYCAWIEDSTRPVDDEDRTWPAVFIIDATSHSEALRWGDVVSRRYCEVRDDASFLRSYVYDEADEPGDYSELPVVRVGQLPSDDGIGW